MFELLIVASVLIGLVVIIVIYGSLRGGVEGMLEKERNFNTIAATDQVEVTVFIDFFKQIKRIDSLYFNARTKTLQYKKNNHLSLPFTWNDIKEITFQINEDVVFSSAGLEKFTALMDHLKSADLEDKELILMLKLSDLVHTIPFESPERSLRVVKTLAQWENQSV